MYRVPIYGKHSKPSYQSSYSPEQQGLLLAHEDDSHTHGPMTLAQLNKYGAMHFSQKVIPALGIEMTPTDPPVKWRLKMTMPGGGNLEEDPVKKVMEVEEMILVLGYEGNNA